jgi:hypothetical protein
MHILASDWTVLAAGLAMVLLLAENMFGVTGAALLLKARRDRHE